MIVLDAGVVIALFTPGDVHHERAKRVIADGPGPFLMHSLTVAETLVGAARVGREAEMWRTLRGLDIDVVAMGADEPLLLAGLRARHALTMPETCVLAAAVHLNAPLVTVDERLGVVADGMALRAGLLPEGE